MATFISLRASSRNIVEDICNLQNQAELYRHQEYWAAVKIQKWFRGNRCREYLRHLVKCAVVVQRHWRGHLGREKYRQNVHLSVKEMQTRFYNAMAVRIQRRWRGYFVRKHVHNYYARKKYLESLVLKNEMVRDQINEFREQYDMEEKKKRISEYERKMEYKARRNHYLLSTTQKPGIYNSPYQPYPQEMEYRLRAANPIGKDEDHLRIKKDPTMGLVDPDGDRPLVAPKSLPPLKEKIQGPFRKPKEVQMQRYSEFNPSLRVSTDFQSLHKARVAMKQEEWRNQIISERFQPFSKSETSYYEPLLHTSSQYGHLSYGTKYFRESSARKNSSTTRMQVVVSPIPFLDKFGKTYTKGAVILQ